MSKTILNMLLVITILAFPLLGDELTKPVPKPSVLKSALLPGWGEHSFDARSRGYLFNGIEAALWIFAGTAYTAAISHENDLYYFATEYGQVSDPHLRSDAFLDRVSQFENMDAYNEQMLRNRQWDRVYSAENGEYWSWETAEKRHEYFDIKTQRYLWRQRVTYAFGAIALNHLVSTMDALYLKRQRFGISLQPELSSESTGFRLSLSF